MPIDYGEKVSSAEIFWSFQWGTRRANEALYYRWFAGDALNESTGKMDPDTGEPIYRYPLKINPIRKMCNIHRSVMVGMVDDYNEPPVGVVMDNKEIEKVVRSIFRSSNAASVFNEAMLMEQVYGGHVFKAWWEPWNKMLPYRIRIESIEQPYFFAIWDTTDKWNPCEAWIGYYITPQVAKMRFPGVNIAPIPNSLSDQTRFSGYLGDITRSENDMHTINRNVVYVEHFTRDSFDITVNGEEVTDKVYGALKGKNPLGRVPLVYIPHERSLGNWGHSLPKDLIGLCKELNAREADLGEEVYEETHQIAWLRNVTADPVQKAIEVDGKGNPMRWAIDLGSAHGTQAGHEPEANYLIPKPPAMASAYRTMLWDDILLQSNVAPVLVGMDDTASGRITGPVTEARAVPSLQHAQTERIDFSTGMVHLVDIVQRLLMEKGPDLGRLGIEIPKVTQKDLESGTRVTWAPMLPLEVMAKVELLNSRLINNGISLETYLDELGALDVKGEVSKIRAWMGFKAEKKAEEKAVPMDENQLEMEKEKHDQEMQMAQEKHEMGMEQAGEKHEVGLKQQQEAAKAKAKAPNSDSRK